MNDLKRDILKEGLVNVPSVVAVCGGFTAFLVGLAGGGVIIAGLGVLSVLAGAGWSATNLTLNFDSIKAKILADRAKALRDERDRRLDDLDDRLIRDRDPRDQTYLREIRRMYDELCDDLQEKKVDAGHAETLMPRIDALFEACVTDLEFSYRLWETQRAASGETKKKIQRQRDEIITNVGQQVDRFSEAVTTLMTLGQKRGASLQQAAAKMDEDLAIAKRVEERMNEIDHPVAPNYDEYLH